MTNEINTEEIVNRITNEVLNDIQKSAASFTNEEIKEKINNKLNKFFDNLNSKKEEEKNKELDADEKFIEKEFTNIDETNDQEKNTREDDSFLSMLDSKNNETEENNEIAEPVEKKKFFRELSDLYKEELKYSLECFKNAFESFKIMKETSIFEKAGIFLVLIIPVVLGGVITLALLLLILLLWQLHILLKVFLRFFEKIESSIKTTITNIKNKIKAMKSSNSWINRLIFSNALYSLIMFNGILYMLINGIIMPLKSAAEVDKILANLISKGVKGITAILRAPSEMTLNTLNANALKSGKTKEKEKTKDKQKLKLKDLLKDKQKLKQQSNDLNKVKEAIKVLNIKNEVKKSLTNKLELENKNSINDRLNNLGENANALKTPSSSQLSDTEIGKNIKEQMNNKIMQNLTDLLANDIIKNIKTNEIKDSIEKKLNDLTNIDTERSEVERKIQEDKILSNQDLKNNQQNLENMGVDHNLANNTYEKNISEGVSHPEATLSALSQSTPDWNNKTESEKLDIALEYGKMRDSHQDIEQANDMQNDWLKNNPSAGLQDFYNEKTSKAEEAFRAEGKEFEDRYGQNCQELIAQEMISRGLDPKHNLNNEEFKEIAKSIVENSCCKTEAEKISMMKDLGEFNAAFLDKEKCRQELNYFQQHEKEHSFVEQEKGRNNSADNSMTMNCNL